MIADALAKARKALERAGVEHPGRQAEALLAKVLARDRAALLAHGDEILAPEDALAFENLCLRRAAREPLEYLLEGADFAGIRLLCDPRALIPRPETEDLVDLACRAVKGIPHPRIADLGTGTGALALAIRTRLPQAEILATDASEEALALARLNARVLGLSVDFRLGTDLKPLTGLPPFDALVGNPPYIASGDIPGLMPEVRDWEPRAALDGGPDGLEILKRWITAAPAALKPGGWLGLEIGQGQDGAVERLFQSAGFSGISTTLDFGGIGRFVSGRTPHG